MSDFFWIYAYAIKYYLQGDSWENSVDFAKFLIKGGKK